MAPQGARFNGAVTWYRCGASGVAHRLWLALHYALAETFVMSPMRDLEVFDHLHRPTIHTGHVDENSFFAGSAS